MAKRAVDRLSLKLEKLKGSGQTIEMAEEFRILTLQVIGELILSLSPEESERIFPQLYLPIVVEVWLNLCSESFYSYPLSLRNAYDDIFDGFSGQYENLGAMEILAANAHKLPLPQDRQGIGHVCRTNGTKKVG